MRARRKALGLTQQQAAIHAGWKHATSWLIFEKGETDPTLRTFEKIAQALKLSPVELARLCVQAAQHADTAGGERRSVWEGGA